MRKPKSSEFRPLNSSEWEAITALDQRNKLPDSSVTLADALSTSSIVQVSYETMQGGFCICVILVPSEESDVFYLYRGASRRSYKDKDNPTRGEMKAFIRAILHSRPKEVRNRHAHLITSEITDKSARYITIEQAQEIIRRFVLSREDRI